MVQNLASHGTHLWQQSNWIKQVSNPIGVDILQGMAVWKTNEQSCTKKGKGKRRQRGGGCVGENKQKGTRRGLAHHSTIELSPLITIPSHLPLNVSTIGLGGHRITRLCTIIRIILLEELRSIYGIIGTSCFDQSHFFSWPPMGACVCVSLLLIRSFHQVQVALAYNMYLLVTFQQFSKGKHALFIIMEELT